MTLSEHRSFMAPDMSTEAASHYDAIIKRMTPDQKFASAESLWWTAWELKMAGVRMQHPDWSESQVKDHVHHLFLRASS
jgi:hypothetical protein